ncbi:MAG: hypothetical protein MK135_14565, partial [Polyangiaceae bacterium]|nr:hypothetical protein [Polyangiaceae bacterium]
MKNRLSQYYRSQFEPRLFLGMASLGALSALFLAPSSWSPQLRAWAWGTGALSGFILALVAQIIATCLYSLKFWQQALAWLALGLGYGTRVALDLEAFAKLMGKHATLALFALGASYALGLTAAVGGLLVQPQADGRLQLQRLRTRYRWLLRLGLTLLLPALIWLDENAFPLTYPSAHSAIRWLVIWLVYCLASSFDTPALASKPEQRPLLRWGLRL